LSDEVRKAPLNRPRHPYIPKKLDSTGSLFSGTLRSSSAGKHSPKKMSPSDTVTREKSAAIPIKKTKKENILSGSDSSVEKAISPERSGRSPPTQELPRSHTEILTGVYSPSFRRQRSHHISNSPPTARFTPPDTTSPLRDRPSSPNKLVQSAESNIEGFVSIRRKPKARNINDSLTPASRSLLKSKAAEMKKIKQQVVTAKDLGCNLTFFFPPSHYLNPC
jgi:hypothetical protein